MRAFRGRQSVVVFIAELAILSSVPAVAELLAPGWPRIVFGLSRAALFPLVTGFYGLAWGAGSAALACAEAAAVRGFAGAATLSALLPCGTDTLALAIGSLAAALSVAFMRNRILLFRSSLLERFRNAVHEAVKMRKQSDVLEKVNRVLESRISSQKDSLTILHEQIRKLASLSLDQALDTILETDRKSVV